MLDGKPPPHHRGKTLDYVMDQAGEATNIPPEPCGGIPPQRLPGFIRWPIRVFVLPFVLLDLAMQKVAKWIIKPPFRQEGHCLKRGNCCHYILIEKQEGLLGRLHYLWNTEVNGFYPRESKAYDYEGKEVSVMGCRYLKKDGSCSQYRLRPTVCRQWPLIEYFGRPQSLKGCGYRAVVRNPKPDEKKNHDAN